MIIFYSFHVNQNAGLTQITENHRLSFLELIGRLQRYHCEAKHTHTVNPSRPEGVAVDAIFTRLSQELMKTENDDRELQEDYILVPSPFRKNMAS